MADQVVNYQCPACTGPLHYVGESNKLVCDYCGSAYDLSEIEAMVKDKEEKAAEAAKQQAAEQWDKGDLSEDWGADAAGMKTYSCPSCGAELMCDANTAATCCPYCGNQTVIPGQFSGALKPEYVIPFKKEKAAAIAALKEHYKGKVLLPKSFAEGNHIEEIQGVYVPFWLFDGQADGRMAFHTTTETTHRQGNEEITTTKHFDVRRAGSLSFEKVPVDASSRMPDGHMDSIEPFDYSEMREFSMVYMPGFLADKYDVEPEECGKRMEERCEKSMEEALSNTVTGYDSKTVVDKQIHVRKGDVHYAMLPVWMLATRWNDQNFLFAMNGQSGHLVGDLPMDKGKFWGMLAGLTAVLIAVMMAVNNLFFSEPMEGGAMILACIVAPIVIAVLIMLGLKGQLKTVRPQTAGFYISGDGLTLRERSDRYVRTTTQRRTIETKSK